MAESALAQVPPLAPLRGVHHVWFFTPRTLRRLGGAAGFGLIHWETPMLPRGGAMGSLGAVYRALLQATRSGTNLEYYGKRL